MKKYLALLLAPQFAWPAYAIERNVASQRLEVQEIDSATGAPKTGDAAQLTAYASIDGGTLTALTDTSATESSSTNAPGVYWFDLAQAETNGTNILFTGKSSTSGCYIVPRMVATLPSGLSTLTIASNAVNSDAKKINGVSASSVTTIGANVGTTQPVNFTGTSSGALAKVDVLDFGSVAATTVGGLPLVVNAGVGRTWYVNASTGSDSNSGVTDAAPFATYGAANTAAKFGDTVFIDGDYTTTITMDKPLHIKGRGRGKSRIVSSGTNDIVISIPNTSDAAINGFMISDIAIFGVGSNATGIGGDDLNNIRMERVSVTAPTGIDLGGDARGQMFFNGLRVEATGTVGIKSRSNCSVRLQDSYVYLSTSTDANVAAITLSGSVAVLDNVRALCVQTGASSHVTAGITNRHGTGTVGSETSLGLTKLYNCDVRAVASSASNTGEVRGLTYSYSAGDDTQPFYATADSLNVETSNSGSGGAVDIRGNPTSVGSFLTGQRMHYSTTGGNVTIKATDDTVAANLDAAVSTRSQAGDVMKVSSGTGANQINLSGGHVTNVDTLTTYTGNTPQAGDSYTRLGAPAGASHAADTAAIKAELDDGTTGLAAIKTAAGSGGSSGGPIEQRAVANSRILEVHSRTDGTFGVVGKIRMTPGEAHQLWALEYKGTQLPVGGVLYGITSATVGGAQSANLTVNSSGVDHSQAKLDLSLSSGASSNDTINVVVTVQLTATETVIVTVPVQVGS